MLQQTCKTKDITTAQLKKDIEIAQLKLLYKP